jgi:iron complex outermembrane receptor protein
VNRLVVRAIGLLIVFLIHTSTPRTAFAQNPGQLAGSIVDQTGGVLTGVMLTLRGPATRQGQSDAEGRFQFRDLPAGEYELQALLPGFASVHRIVRVEHGQMVPLLLTMAVAALEQTVVTAAKSGAVDIQATPMAISAVPSEDVTRLAIRAVDEAAALMPSVTFTQNGNYGQLSIRGIGTNAVYAGADPSSAIYLDGVYLGRPSMAFADFLDLDRIEVLRGPQGTLYGRNALGGALNLISKTPTNDFQASARITAGNLDERRVEARLSGALRPDTVMASVAFARGARDGYVLNLEHPDRRLGGDDLTSARGQLRVVVNRRTDLLVSTDVADQDGPLLVFNKVLRVKPGFTVDNPSDLREVRASTSASSNLTQSGTSMRITSALTPSTTLTSLTAF